MENSKLAAAAALCIGSLLSIPTPTIAQPCEPGWSPLRTGVSYQGKNGYVTGPLVFDDGDGAALYFGGAIDRAGGLAVEGFARWDGSAWSVPSGGGLTGTMGGGPPAIFAMTVHDDGSGPALYAGGIFKYAGGQESRGVARWNGQAWSPVAHGVTGQGGAWGQVNSMAVWDRDGNGPDPAVLVIGGSFEVPGHNVAVWDGQALGPMGNGVGGNHLLWVTALASFDDGSGPVLYAGVTDPGSDAIYRWTGASWEQMVRTDDSVGALAALDDGTGPALYAAGAFTKIGDDVVRGLARWDGHSWQEAGGGLSVITHGNVSGLTIADIGSGPALLVGGQFDAAGGNPAAGIAAWNGKSWNTFQNGLGDHRPYEYRYAAGAAVWDDGSGPALVVGGLFDTAGDVYASNVASFSLCRPCHADCDGNGSIDSFDFLCFTDRFNAEDPEADCSGDGGLDLFDFLCFTNAFNAGC